MEAKFKALIGLGNPGKGYEQTYHNTGLNFLRYLGIALGAGEIKTVVKKGFNYRKAGGVFLIESKAFMNQSGRAVLEALRYLKLKPDEIMVVHDDSDIELGQWKISKDRGAAGHNGVTAVITTLKTKKIYRLRIGIRPASGGARTETRRIKAEEFVLKKINSKDKARLTKTFELIAAALFSASIGSGAGIIAEGHSEEHGAAL